MASKKKPVGRPATGRKQTVTIFARVEPDLGHVFSDYVEKLRPKTSTTAVVSMLIEEHLKSLGLWPPTDDTTTS